MGVFRRPIGRSISWSASQFGPHEVAGAPAAGNPAPIAGTQSRQKIRPAFPHEAVKHSVAEYVQGMAHTNGIESFWAMLKRTHTGTFHKISPKHLNRYVQEFAGKHNERSRDTLDIMRHVAAGLIGKRLMYLQLIADNGVPSGARG